MKNRKRALITAILGIVMLVVGIGLWVGVSALSSLKKITADSTDNSLISLIKPPSKDKIKGQAEGRTNILLLGMGGKKHPGGTLTDTNIVLSINWKTNKVAMISVPRDLWVAIPNYGSAKINEAYFYGEKNPKITGGGGKVASDTISKVLGIPIHYYLSIDFEGFKKVVDEIGGIDINVEKALYDPFYPAPNMIDYDPVRIPAGQQHMDGKIALKYARSRETTSDFDRSRRQQQVIFAIKEKTMKVGILANPKTITDLFGILSDHLRTSISISDIKALVELSSQLDTQNITNKVFDTAPGSPLTSLQDERGYIIVPKKGANNFTDLQKIAQNIFDETNIADTTKSATTTGKNISEETATGLRIEILNGTSKTGAATQAAKDLKKQGYNVVRTGNAIKTYDKTVIFNCYGEEAEKLSKELGNLFEASVKTKTACTGIDIQIIIGQDYLGTPSSQ